ncbi:DNA-3-methyladenine glycosylase 2 [SAR202 cluster bacterium AC-409-J13_OGT_754m]|nr:DNA-3-methyladenine glycosylase 2 [SAR202 cluster bacterium AC-409-J13_OGT_754m]
MRMKFPEPFNLQATLESGQAHRWRSNDGWYWGVVYGNLIKIRQYSGNIEAFAAPKEPEQLAELLHSYFRLDDDLLEIYGSISKDSRIEKMLEIYSGLRLLRQEPWECLCAFICSSISNIPRIGKNMESLSDALGKPVNLLGETRNTFPTAEAIATAGVDFLRQLGLGFRAKYVTAAAQKVAEGELNLDEVRSMPYQEAKDILMELPGVGAKIADCVLVFSMDKLEAFPIDRWVSRAMHEWYKIGNNLSYEEVADWAKGYFDPYAGYAQQYLFHGRRLGSMDL